MSFRVRPVIQDMSRNKRKHVTSASIQFSTQRTREAKAVKTHEVRAYEPGVYIVVDGFESKVARPITLLNDEEQVDLLADHKRVSPNIVLTRLVKAGGKVVGVTTPGHKVDDVWYRHVWTVVIE